MCLGSQSGRSPNSAGRLEESLSENNVVHTLWGKMSYLKDPLIACRSPPMSRTSSQATRLPLKGNSSERFRMGMQYIGSLSRIWVVVMSTTICPSWVHNENRWRATHIDMIFQQGRSIRFQQTLRACENEAAGSADCSEILWFLYVPMATTADWTWLDNRTEEEYGSYGSFAYSIHDSKRLVPCWGTARRFASV